MKINSISLSASSAPKRRWLRTTSGIAFTLALAGSMAACSEDSSEEAASPTSTDGEGITIVASTAIWGDIASTVVTDDDDITVETILDSTADDPHSYEASAKDLATLKDADIVVANGGGYDNWLTNQVPDDVALVTAVPLAEDHHHGHDDADHDDADHDDADHDDGDHEDTEHEDAHAEDGHEDGHEHGHEDGHDESDHHHENPHVWFDMDIVDDFAANLAAEITELDPDATVDAGAVTEQTDSITKRYEQLPAADVLLTESVAEGIVEHSALVDVTPASFATAVAHESEPSASAVASAQQAITDGTVDVLITNEQSHTSAAGTLIDAARDNDVPIVNVNETPDADQDYFEYVNQVLDELEAAHD